MRKKKVWILLLVLAAILYLVFPQTVFHSENDLTIDSIIFNDAAGQKIDVTEQINAVALKTTLTMMKSGKLPLSPIDDHVDYEINLRDKNGSYTIYIAQPGRTSTICAKDSQRGYAVQNSDAWRGILYSLTKDAYK